MSQRLRAFPAIIELRESSKSAKMPYNTLPSAVIQNTLLKINSEKKEKEEEASPPKRGLPGGAAAAPRASSPAMASEVPSVASTPAMSTVTSSACLLGNKQPQHVSHGQLKIISRNMC